MDSLHWNSLGYSESDGRQTAQHPIIRWTITVPGREQSIPDNDNIHGKT